MPASIATATTASTITIQYMSLGLNRAPPVCVRHAGLCQCDAQFLGEDFDHVLNADLVASDDHVVVLCLPDAFGRIGEAS